MGTFNIAQTQKGAKLYLQPNADGCNIDLTPNGAPSNFQCVADAVSTPDEDTTYVDSSAINLLYDLYLLPNHTTESGTINHVKIYSRAKSTPIAQHEDGIYKIILTENACANIYKSNNINLTTVYTSYNNTWTTNPRTTAAWTWADIDNLEIGEECNSPTIAGAARTLTLRPNAVGTSSNLTPVGAGTGWQCTDEAIPNNFTDYVAQYTTLDRRDTYNLSNHTTEFGVIDKVSVFGVIYSPAGGVCATVRYRNSIRIGATYYNGAFEIPPPTVWTLISTDWITNPNSGVAWTWADIDNLEAGIWIEGTTCYFPACTQVYVIVYYTEASNPEVRTTQCYAEVNYDAEVACSLNVPKQVSVDHQQNIKMLNFWSGNRAVYGLSRNKRTMVLTGTQYGNDSCDEIECVRSMGEAGDNITLSNLGSSEFDKTFKIISFGWVKRNEHPLTMDWILELEYIT